MRCSIEIIHTRWKIALWRLIAKMTKSKKLSMVSVSSERLIYCNAMLYAFYASSYWCDIDYLSPVHRQRERNVQERDTDRDNLVRVALTSLTVWCSQSSSYRSVLFQHTCFLAPTPWNILPTYYGTVFLFCIFSHGCKVMDFYASNFDDYCVFTLMSWA